MSILHVTLVLTPRSPQPVNNCSTCTLTKLCIKCVIKLSNRRGAYNIGKYLTQEYHMNKNIKVDRLNIKTEVALESIFKGSSNAQTIFGVPDLVQSVILSQQAVIPVIDEEETLILEEVSRSKITEAPSELTKVSLVNTSLKKLKIHLFKFDVVVKKWITPDAITKGGWGFEHTKVVFLNEIIPFLKTLKDIFNVFDKDLLNEVTEVQIVFNQMEAVVQQCSDILLTVMNSTTVYDYSVNLEMQSSESCNKCFDLDAKLLKKQNVYNELLKNKSCDNQNALKVLEYFENNDLKAQLQAKDTTMRKLKEHIKSTRENDKEEKVKQDTDEIETINIDLEHSVAKLLSKNECLHREIDHLKQIYKDQCDSIKRTRVRTKEHSESLIAQLNSKSVEKADLKAQIQDKVFVITSLKNDLRKLKGKEIVENAEQIPNVTIIVPGMFKRDLDPLAPRLLKNRDAHIDYLKYTQEQADILQGIVKQAKTKQPLDNALDFSCKHAKQIQELLVESSKTPDSNKLVLPSTGLKSSTSVSRSQPTSNTKNDRISQTPSSNIKNKVKAQLRRVNISSNNKNHVKDPICDANVKHTMLNVNSELICVKCKQYMFDANHDVRFLKFVNDVNVRSKSKFAKQSQHHNIWKPTGKVFTEIGYKWKPTGKLFTLVGNSCPLTRITSTKVVPLKETISHSVETQKLELKVYIRRPKLVKSIGSNKKSKIIESRIANNSEPNHSWGSNATDVPSSSSLVNDRLSRLFSGNETISRVDYVEGLRHNLFSVGQSCDSDLEVAFWKNTCFIQNLDSVDLLSRSRDTNLYTKSLDDMLKTSLTCLLSKASKTKSWLWHCRLSYLNFACALGKSKKSSHQPKVEDINQEKIYLLHMDLYGPMRVESINRKKYILVIVDDYSRFTWVKVLRSKVEDPDAIIKGIKIFKFV
ncbi:retrovirus-related pol polyprotein from transposon TNT 1-94 [Tanacetum coccineum]